MPTVEEQLLEGVPTRIDTWTETYLRDGKRGIRMVTDVRDATGIIERRVFLSPIKGWEWTASWGPVPLNYPYGELAPGWERPGKWEPEDDPDEEVD